MRTTAVNSEVVVVLDEDGKTRKGTIVEAITQGSARIAFSETDETIAIYSESGEPGTFHYPDEQKEVAANAKRKAATETPKATAKPAAASK